MRLSSLLIIAVAAASVVSGRPAAAAPPFADPLCPRAVPKVLDFNAAGASNDAGKIAATARAAADAYQLCAADAQVTKGVAIEPTVNYSKTREAQFLVVEGRALLTLGNNADALAPLKNARRLADEVATWQPEPQLWVASQTTGGTAMAGGNSPTQNGGNTAMHNSDKDNSRYKTAALEIRATADEALGRFQAVAPASPKPR